MAAATPSDSHLDPDVPRSAAHAFIPLEANPELMTQLIRKLGVSPALQLHDVYSLTDPSLLAFVPRPALALLLVFPVSAAYESARLAEDAPAPDYAGRGPAEPVLWFRQTIRNACGLMGLLHATLNGRARDFIESGSDLDKLRQAAIPLAPRERSQLLETTPALATAHHEAASQGDTAAPDARDDIDLHYVAFVRVDDGEDAGSSSSSTAGKSGAGTGALWELDGRRKGPLKRGELAKGEDVLSPSALQLGPLQFLEREGGDLRFSAVALAGSLD